MPVETKNTAVGILKERFARGEITTEEYEQRKDALLKLAGPGSKKQIIFAPDSFLLDPPHFRLTS